MYHALSRFVVYVAGWYFYVCRPCLFGVRGSKRASLQPTTSLAGGQCKSMVPEGPTGTQKLLGKCHLHIRHVKVMGRVAPLNMNVQKHDEKKRT